jgi:hypothetical protein
MVRVLFADVYFDSGKGRVSGPGYIHVKDGFIVGYGEGEPPEELALAELVVSGEALVVYPGPALAAVAVELYPFRSVLPGRLKLEDVLLKPSRCVSEAVRSLGGDAAYYAALMAFYELALAGATRVYPVAFHPAEVARALRDSGLSGAILVPRGCALEAEPPDSTPPGVQVVELHCSGGGEAVLGEGRLCIGDRCIPTGKPPVHVEPWVSPWQRMLETGFEGYKAYIVEGHRLADEGYRPFTGKAYLVAVDVAEPPSWMPDPRSAKAWRLGSRVRVDTVVSAGSIVVDGGEMLSVGRDAARRAAEKLGDVVRRVEQLCGEEGDAGGSEKAW